MSFTDEKKEDSVRLQGENHKPCQCRPHQKNSSLSPQFFCDTSFIFDSF